MAVPQFIVAALAILLFAAIDGAQAFSGDRRGWGNSRSSHWVNTWTSMPQLTETQNLPPAPFNETGRVFFNSTIRQTLHMSIGGSKIRIRISNAFGGSDLPITAVSVALPLNGSAGVQGIIPGSVKTVKFSGSESFIIPNGALAVSDPIDFNIRPQSMLTVSIYTAQGQTTNSITSHPGSRTTSWFSFGNSVSSQSLANNSLASVAHWYFVSGVEVWAPEKSRAFAIVGDSITDGRGSETDKNNRWPDLLLAKMQKNRATADIAVINQAAGGNRILADGLGPNALGRIDRDVLSQSNVGYAMIFEGVNDIGQAPTTAEAQKDIADRVILAYKQIVTRIHTFGIPVFAATITPFNGTGQSYGTPMREEARQRVNDFIRNSKTFDAVVDFDKIVRDPANPIQLLQKYDSGDFLHPSVAGYQAIADAFPLDIFAKFADGVDEYQ